MFENVLDGMIEILQKTINRLKKIKYSLKSKKEKEIVYDGKVFIAVESSDIDSHDCGLCYFKSISCADPILICQARLRADKKDIYWIQK